MEVTSLGKQALQRLDNPSDESLVIVKKLLENAEDSKNIQSLTEAVAPALGREPDSLEDVAEGLVARGYLEETEEGEEPVTMSSNGYGGILTPITQETTYTGKVKDCSKCHGPITDIGAAVSESDMCISCMGDDWKGLDASLKQGDVSLSGGDVQQGSITLPPGSLTL